MKNKKVLEEIINRIDDSKHDICLYVSDTCEVIHIDDNLKKLIKLYYEDQLQTAQLKEAESVGNNYAS